MAAAFHIPVSAWFNNADLSDCQVHLMTVAAKQSKPPDILKFDKDIVSEERYQLEEDAPDNDTNMLDAVQFPPHSVTPGSETKVYPAHKLILKSSWEFFLARISEPWQQQPAIYVMTVESEADMPAAELVIKYMYTRDLVQDMPLELLLRILSVADQFQVYHLSDICAQRIHTQVAAGSPCWDEVLLLLHWSHPTLQGLLEPSKTAALPAVLKHFVDLEKSWVDANERSQFLQLPFQAVAWLIAQPTLKVASENTVVVAINAWLAGSDLAAQCSDAEKGQLWRLIRGGSLGSHNLSYQLPKLPTFRNLPDCTEILSDIIRAKTIPNGPENCLELDELRTANVFQARRPASDRTFACLNLALTVQELTAAFEKVKTPPTIRTEFTSKTEYFAGYFWKAMLSVDAGGKYDEWHKHHVGVVVHVDEKGIMPAGHYCGYSMSLSRLGQDTNCAGYQMKQRLAKFKAIHGSYGWLGVMGADWQALAEDGVVHLGFKCTALD